MRFGKIFFSANWFWFVKFLLSGIITKNAIFVLTSPLEMLVCEITKKFFIKQINK
jgi:hypothetical protein